MKFIFAYGRKYDRIYGRKCFMKQATGVNIIDPRFPVLRDNFTGKRQNYTIIVKFNIIKLFVQKNGVINTILRNKKYGNCIHRFLVFTSNLCMSDQGF